MEVIRRCWTFLEGLQSSVKESQRAWGMKASEGLCPAWVALIASWHGAAFLCATLFGSAPTCPGEPGPCVRDPPCRLSYVTGKCT